MNLYEKDQFDMQKESKKLVDSLIFEGMTSIRALLRAIKEKNPTNDRRIEKILYNCEKLDQRDKCLAFLSHRADEMGFALEGVTSQVIDEMALGQSHGGIIAECSARHIPSLSDASIVKDGFYCMIQGIEDPYNFGYALRSLYAMGARGIILPERNWMSAAGVVARASAGASELFEVYTAEPIDCIDLFHEQGYRVVCADLRTETVLYDADLSLPLLLLVGGEKRGISREVLDRADLLVKVDYGREFDASLSAASASTILGYEIFRQNRKKSEGVSL